MIAEKISAVARLTLEQEWLLASELWQEVERSLEDLPNSPSIDALLARRFEEYDADPSTAMTLAEFKRRFQLP